jgi:hypothetical protein
MHLIRDKFRYCTTLALHLLRTAEPQVDVAFVLHAKATSLDLGLVEQTIEHIDLSTTKV